MKILIGYYTKSGTTAKCAEMLRNQFHNHTTEVVDLSATQPNLGDYDTVLLGASIRIGRMDKRFRKYLKANETSLTSCRLGFFSCCGASELAPDIMRKDIPAALVECAAAIDAFGGELIVKTQKNLIAKITVWMMRRAIKNGELDEDLCDSGSVGYPEILPDHIARFADEIKRS